MSAAKKLKIYALTGGIGSGKSTAAAYFRRHRYKVISADKLARHSVKRGSNILKKLAVEFKNLGINILSKNGTLNRRLLGYTIFSNIKLRRKVEKLIHKEVRRLFFQELKKLRTQKTKIAGVIYDVPLFFEAKLPRTQFNGVIYVYAPLKVAAKRAAKRLRLPLTDILRRAKAQLSPEMKRRMSDYVLDNSTPNKKKLEFQVKDLILDLSS